MIEVGSRLAFGHVGENVQGRILVAVRPLNLTAQYFAAGYADRSTCEMIIAAEPYVEGKVVCDRGTGAGLVAAAIAKLDATKVIATEIWPPATGIAIEHWTLNEVDIDYRFSPEPVECDVLIHNIPDGGLDLLLEALPLVRERVFCTLVTEDIQRLTNNPPVGWEIAVHPYEGETGFERVDLWQSS